MKYKAKMMGLAIAILLVGIMTKPAIAADSISVTRADGTLDAFAVVQCPYCATGVLSLYHTAITSHGTGTVYSNDHVALVGSTCNLIVAFWTTSNQNGPHNELHVRAYDSNADVVEFIWGWGNTTAWSGPFLLKTAQ